MYFIAVFKTSCLKHTNPDKLFSKTQKGQKIDYYRSSLQCKPSPFIKLSSTASLEISKLTSSTTSFPVWLGKAKLNFFAFGPECVSWMYWFGKIWFLITIFTKIRQKMTIGPKLVGFNLRSKPFQNLMYLLPEKTTILEFGRQRLIHEDFSTGTRMRSKRRTSQSVANWFQSLRQ